MVLQPEMDLLYQPIMVDTYSNMAQWHFVHHKSYKDYLQLDMGLIYEDTLL